MQVFRLGTVVLVVVSLLWALAAATSLDGTNAISYQTNNYVFRDGDSARGFVRLNNGFTVLPGATMTMDTVVSASGGFDLRDRGVLMLAGNLMLDGLVTITNSGYIRGKTSTIGSGNTIFLNGDLTLSADPYLNVLHLIGDVYDTVLSGDLIIDGRGNTLTFGNKAQVFVDQNVTLTLRNMTIRTGSASLNNPSIQLAGPGSRLALDNVVFELGSDFHFSQGQLFIHNEVAVTGTSAFVYQSPLPSYITSGATWSFEQGTTFSVAPATYTDVLYSAGTARSNNFILFADATAALSLSGCSFKTTYTGLRLTKGLVQFDNRVAIETGAGVALDTVAPLTYFTGVGTSGLPRSISWTPDGRYLAVACSDVNIVNVYRFNGVSGFASVANITGLTSVRGVAWSPDGRFLAVAGGSFVAVYRFNGTSTLVQVGSNVGTSGGSYYVSWSLDGKVLAVATYNGGTIDIFKFDVALGLVFAGYKFWSGGEYPNSVAFSPDGKYIVIGNDRSYYFWICTFTPSTTYNPIQLVQINANEHPSGVAWSPDGRFIAAAGGASGGATMIEIYRFNGTSSVTRVGGPIGIGGSPNAVAWSPDGRYVVTGDFSGTKVFSFDGVATLTYLGSMGIAGDYGGVAWSPDGNFVAVTSVRANAVQVGRFNYDYNNQPPQAFASGLLFGDSAKGSAYNLNVQVNGGARVELNGKIKDDSV